MIQAHAIKPGDKIRVVSPAGRIAKEKVQPAITWLEERGYKVEAGKHLFAEHFQFAGTDQQRLEDLQLAIDDADCKAIICARGGYGSVRIVGQLDFTSFKKYPKWLVGYSDITVLHLALNNLGIASIHGTMPPFFFNDDGQANDNALTLLALLEGREKSIEFESEIRNRTGQSKGQIVGGNLSIITSLLGTQYEIDTEGKILFVEDVDEYLYQVDRMMHQLKLAGKLDKLAGIVVGDFTQIKDNDLPFGSTIEEIILGVVKDFEYPVSFGLKSGHGDVNLAMKFGIEWGLRVEEKSSILRP